MKDAGQKKPGESDPLFNPSDLKRRTMMGIAPAPHLGGMSGSPGAIARAEAEARKQRVAAALRRGPTGTGPPPPHRLQEEVVEPAPPRPTGPPAPAEPALPPPAFGTTTMLMTPQTPHIPLTLPAQKPSPSDETKLPSSSGWDVAEPVSKKESEPELPSAPTVLVEPPHMPNKQASTVAMNDVPRRHTPLGIAPPPHEVGQARPGAGTLPVGPPQAVQEEPAPATARMLRAAQPNAAPPVAASPTTALVVRPFDPGPRHSITGPLDERLVLLTQPDSPRAASFRLLRDSLLGKNLPRVVAVSSVAPHAGKTTCAINLALALAEQGSTKVLLVDANFFEPELARVFSLDRLGPAGPSEPWLFPYTICSVTSTLHVAGILNAEQGRRFEQQRFDALIDRLCRASYDYIIVDTPALAGSPAVRAILNGADGTILAVRSGATTARDLRRAADQIPANKALGVALIDAAEA